SGFCDPCAGAVRSARLVCRSSAHKPHSAGDADVVTTKFSGTRCKFFGTQEIEKGLHRWLEVVVLAHDEIKGLPGDGNEIETRAVGDTARSDADVRPPNADGLGDVRTDWT